MKKYPSIEKPQYQFYRKESLRDINTEQSIYDLVFETNKDNMDLCAVKYLHNSWSFSELKKLSDQLADAFRQAGFKQGETILIGLPACVEALICLFAVNKLGGVSKWIDMRVGEEDLVNYIEANSCRFFVVFDALQPVIKDLKSSVIEKVLIVKPSEMQPWLFRAYYALASMWEVKAPPTVGDAEVVSFRKFLQTGDPNSEISQLPFDKNRPSVIIQSSGTTGKPKSIVHSDFSATSCARSLSFSDMTIEPGKVVLVLLPPWIAYSLGQAILYPLANGSTLLLEPSLNPDSLIKHLGHYNNCFGIPIHYRYLYDHFDKLSHFDKKKVYDIDFLASGGDKVSPDENESFDKKFHTPVINGYGNNESWGCLTSNCTQYNKYGSVGIPKYGETVISYNSDTKTENGFNELGEICALANTLFLCYDGDENGTNEVKQMHPDGKIWIHTGDLGVIDEEGFVFLKGRIRRVITRAGFKISAYTIEDSITELPMIRECVAVQVKDPVEEGVPMVFVALHSDDVGSEEVIRNIILGKCNKDLKKYEVPKYIKFVKELPYTTNRKYDFKLLEQEGNDYVDSLNNK